MVLFLSNVKLLNCSVSRSHMFHRYLYVICYRLNYSSSKILKHVVQN